MNERIQGSNVQSDSYFESIVHLLSRDEVFSVHDVLGLKAALDCFIDLAWGDDIHLFDSKAPDQFYD